MGWRYHRRVSLLPGLRVNLSRSGASVSIGSRGSWVTVGHGQRRVTIGLPGTGLSYTAQLRSPVHGGHQLLFALVVAVVVAAVWWAAYG